MVPFSNERFEGVNPSSHVTALSDLELPNRFRRAVMLFKLEISIPSLRTRTLGDRSHPYRKDRWRLHFYFCGHPCRAENRYDSLATPLGN